MNARKIVTFEIETDIPNTKLRRATIFCPGVGGSYVRHLQVQVNTVKAKATPRKKKAKAGK
jgi:hypothetical protein